MRRSRAFGSGLLSVGLLLTLLQWCPVKAQDRAATEAPAQQAATLRQPEVDRLSRGAEDLRKAGRYAEALTLAREALAITLEDDAGPDSLAVARALTLVASIYVDMHNYAEAEPLLRRALQIYETKGNQSDAEAARSRLTQVAELQSGTARPTEFQATEPRRPARRSFHSKQRGAEQSPNDAAPAATEKPTEWQVVPVFYGTDRERIPNEKRADYNELRAHRLELGRALVTIPKNHEIPNIERPWALHLWYFGDVFEGTEDPKEHFTLQEVKALSKRGLLALVRERLAASSRFKNQAIVFVHGYNTSFDNALYRTAQIANDLHFDGAPFVYSWPSGGAIATYGWDRESAEGARPQLREFLDVVTKETKAKSISIIAHSMGNIALLDVLREMNRDKPAGVVINQIILAAPDVSVDDFAALAKSIKGISKGVTLYASSNDRALEASRGFWGSYRIGDVSPAGPALTPGVETIDVTAASTEVFALNHSSYAQNSDLLGDVEALIEHGVHPPEIRSNSMLPVKSAKGDYWRYLPRKDATGSTTPQPE